MPGDKTLLLLKTYLDAIGISGYTVHTAEDVTGFIIVVEIPHSRPAYRDIPGDINGAAVGVLKGKYLQAIPGQSLPPHPAKNLSVLKSMLNIVGRLEHIQPCLVIKLKN